MFRLARAVAVNLLPAIPLLPVAAYTASWHPDLSGRIGKFFAFCAAALAHALAFAMRGAVYSPAAIGALALVISLGFFLAASAILHKGARTK